MSLPSIFRIPHSSLKLPDNDRYTNRFEIHSESSDRVYIVAQDKKKKFWACSCMGWIRYRKCKHLDAMGLPNHQIPYEPKIEQ